MLVRLFAVTSCQYYIHILSNFVFFGTGIVEITRFLPLEFSSMSCIEKLSNCSQEMTDSRSVRKKTLLVCNVIKQFSVVVCS